jgi:hypothetical protein
MEALLPPDLLSSTDKETRLICLRGRKYHPKRAAILLPNFIQVDASAPRPLEYYIASSQEHAGGGRKVSG